MAIIAKNIIVGDGKPYVPPQIANDVKEENTNQYHEIHDGDLHKLINKKSSYLVDMIDLEK